MFKTVGFLIALFAVSASFSQDKGTENYFEKERKFNRYEKQKNYNGPSNWYGSEPASMNEDDEGDAVYYGSNSQPGIHYNPQAIKKYRSKAQRSVTEDDGSEEVLPETEALDEPEESDDTDNSADIDTDTDDSSTNLSENLWKIIVAVILIALLVVILYFVIRSVRPPNKKVIHDVENDWNPEVITKTELELKLEEAEATEDYRECVRIYFTFILKDLIRRELITWKKEKTNYDYVLELSDSPYFNEFNSCVTIYDLVWYGNYQIDRTIYDALRPPLTSFYKKIEVKGE